MSAKNYQPKKLFTLKEANQMLPLVARIVKDVKNSYNCLVEKYHRYQQIHPEESLSLTELHSEELSAMRDEMEKERDRLIEYADELGRLGVVLKGEQEGLVDFPALRDGRVVFLCWKLGEPEIRFWHEVDSGFLGRQEIESSLASGIQSW